MDTTHNTTATRPAIMEESPDVLDSFVPVMVVGKKLKEGMVIVDPILGTPEVWLDHRLPSREGGHWMVHDMIGTQRPSFHFASYCNWHEFPVASKARY